MFGLISLCRSQLYYFTEKLIIVIQLRTILLQIISVATAQAPAAQAAPAVAAVAALQAQAPAAPASECIVFFY